jgi:hypothetical protein
MEEVKARAAPAASASAAGRPHVEMTPEPAPVRPSPALAAQLVPRGAAEIRFDARGNRIPRPDRWNDDDFRWPEPVLPSPELPRALRAQLAAGPFFPRLRSLFEDRPEAVERLCAVAEARAALRGGDGFLDELRAELAAQRWQGRRASASQIARLRAVAEAGAHPAPWRAVAQLLLQKFLVPDRRRERSG